MKRCVACSRAFESSGWTCPRCGAEPSVIDGFPALAPALANDNEGFEPHLFAELAAIEDVNFWFRARNNLILWTLRRYFPDMKSFMEIGCGTGFVLAGVAAAFPDAALTGSEIYSAGLPFAGARAPGARLIQMDARDIGFANEFDAVGAFDVIEHIEQDEAVLRQLHASLRPDGGLLITVPQHRWMWSAQDVAAHHVRRYEAGELRRKVVAAGFAPIFETSFVSLLLPLMMLTRARNAGAKSCDPLEDLRLGKTLNQALLAAMRFEGALIRAGVRFPAGGSRLLVARKAS